MVEPSSMSLFAFLKQTKEEEADRLHAFTIQNRTICDIAREVSSLIPDGSYQHTLDPDMRPYANIIQRRLYDIYTNRIIVYDRINHAICVSGIQWNTSR